MTRDDIKQYIPEKADVTFCGAVATFDVATSEIVKVVSRLCNTEKLPLKLITATDDREEDGCFTIWYVFGVPQKDGFIVPFMKVKNEFPSVASAVPRASGYEMKIKSFFGLTPAGHPDLRQMVLHENWPTDIFPLRKDVDGQARPYDAKGTYAFHTVKGGGIYEISVGPIHAGIIEPGHFRFSVAGEEILLLEARLGFAHKGSEKLFETIPFEEKICLSERISGDSSFSHSLAFCQAVEQLAGMTAPRRARYLRVVYAELERLANHFGDIGAIMADAGFNFGGAHGGRLREIVMRINERLTGSRFLRGVNVVGGVTCDIGDEERLRLSKDLAAIREDLSEIIGIAGDSASLFNRLTGTGTLSRSVADKYGAIGVAGRAVGIECDARIDHPYAAYDELCLSRAEIEQDGDVYARFRVRVKETSASLEMIQRALRDMPDGPSREIIDHSALKKNALVLGIVEGWRGEIVYFIKTDSLGNIIRVVPHDPSFINWSVVGDASFGNVVSDFPLINKSFNLSYSGNDL